MTEYNAYLDFGEYQIDTFFWASNDKEAKSYLKKHFPQAKVLHLNPSNAERNG